MKIIVAGDFCDKYRVKEKLRSKCFSDLFKNVKEVVNTADFRIVNFEFPIVVGKGTPIKKCGPNLYGQIEAVDAIKYAGFNVCTLANNHILDQGVKCCLDTRKLLEQSGVNTVGVGNDIVDASNILYLQKGDQRLAVINCCEHEYSLAKPDTPGANPLNVIQQYNKIQEAKNNANFVLVIVHGGHEHYQLPSPRMKETYRFFIDAGADAVVNHHQHCFSGYELYKNKPIFYGLGNLLFDHLKKRNCKWNEGYMVELDFEVSERTQFNILPYKQCNDTPSVEMMKAEEINIFKSKLSSLNDIIASDSRLKSEYVKYAVSKRREYMSIFSPWRTRIGIALCNRGYLPNLLNFRKLRILSNYLICESHRDIVNMNILQLWDEISKK